MGLKFLTVISGDLFSFRDLNLNPRGRRKERRREEGRKRRREKEREKIESDKNLETAFAKVK